MSGIFQINKDLSNLPQLLDRFEKEIEAAKPNLDLEGKTLAEANREQPTWFCHYSRLLQELKAMESFVESKVEAKKGTLWRQWKENCDRALSSTDISHYIDADSKFNDMKTLYFVVVEMVGNMNALVKAFEQRGYVLRNLTEARIHEMQNSAI